MSLNGLDAVAVAAAHRAALAEPGGWYVLRDFKKQVTETLTGRFKVLAQLCQSRHSRTAAERLGWGAGSKRCCRRI